MLYGLGAPLTSTVVCDGPRVARADAGGGARAGLAGRVRLRPRVSGAARGAAARRGGGWRRGAVGPGRGLAHFSAPGYVVSV